MDTFLSSTRGHGKHFNHFASSNSFQANQQQLRQAHSPSKATAMKHNSNNGSLNQTSSRLSNGAQESIKRHFLNPLKQQPQPSSPFAANGRQKASSQNGPSSRASPTNAHLAHHLAQFPLTALSSSIKLSPVELATTPPTPLTNGHSHCNGNGAQNKLSPRLNGARSDPLAINGNQAGKLSNLHRREASRQLSPLGGDSRNDLDLNERIRLKPLTIEEYENDLRQSASDLELLERVFLGSMACDQLRAALWPYLFGIVNHRGRFQRQQVVGAECNANGHTSQHYLYIEHEANLSKWNELEKTYHLYETQWKSISPDQEQRFSLYRERKSVIERDVVRCDRLHPFYGSDKSENLETLTRLLMTYMMYDFDIGYVQGMSDLAGPILFMYKGNLVKAFWVFVEIMKLFRRNFEQTQKTIHFQLDCLFELIKNTDPIFAQYLEENESSNCYFAFRAIVCQFKRELMKEDENDYSKVLFLWDTIWSAKRRRILLDECSNGNLTNGTASGLRESLDSNNGEKLNACEANNNCCNSPKHNYNNNNNTSNRNHNLNNVSNGNSNNHSLTPMEQYQSDTPRQTLTETEIFVLSLCLSMIKRERDSILANKLDATDIHLHFINPKLASDLDGFIEQAINIFLYIKTDIKKFTTQPKRNEQMLMREMICESSLGSAEGYDLLNDFFIITSNPS